MSDALGIAAIVVGAALGLALVWRWGSVPPAVGLGGQAIAGALLAVGGLAVQERVNAASWWFGPLVLAGLTALHAYALFGPAGRTRHGVPTMVAAEGSAAYKERNP